MEILLAISAIWFDANAVNKKIRYYVGMPNKLPLSKILEIITIKRQTYSL